MEIYDTNKYIEEIRFKKDVIKEGVSVIEFNILEWIRGKEKEQRKQEFAKLEKLVRYKKGSYCFNSSLRREEELLNNSKTPFEYKYTVAEKVALLTLKDLIEFCVSFSFMLITIIAFVKNHAVINNGELQLNNESDKELALINYSLKNGTDVLANSHTLRKIRGFLPLNKEQTDSWLVKLFNEVIDHFNNKFKTIRFNSIKSKHFNCRELTEDNTVKISQEDIERYVDVLIKTKRNENETRKLFKKLLSSVLVYNQSFEFNHISDLYLQYAAECLGADFISKDKKRIVWKDK